MNIET